MNSYACQVVHSSKWKFVLPLVLGLVGCNFSIQDSEASKGSVGGELVGAQPNDVKVRPNLSEGHNLGQINHASYISGGRFRPTGLSGVLVVEDSCLYFDTNLGVEASSRGSSRLGVALQGQAMSRPELMRTSTR